MEAEVIMEGDRAWAVGEWRVVIYQIESSRATGWGGSGDLLSNTGPGVHGTVLCSSKLVKEVDLMLSVLSKRKKSWWSLGSSRRYWICLLVTILDMSIIDNWLWRWTHGCLLVSKRITLYTLICIVLCKSVIPQGIFFYKSVRVFWNLLVIFNTQSSHSVLSHGKLSAFKGPMWLGEAPFLS